MIRTLCKRCEEGLHHAALLGCLLVTSQARSGSPQVPRKEQHGAGWHLRECRCPVCQCVCRWWRC